MLTKEQLKAAEKEAKKAALEVKKAAEKEAKALVLQEAKDKAQEEKDTVYFTASAGHQVPDKNYVYNKEDDEPAHAPEYIVKKIGTPVVDEELISTFHKTFAPADEFLLYKELRREVYVIIVPLRFVTELGSEEDSVSGDMQIHAISFLHEGSITPELLEIKLRSIAKNLNYKK